MNKLEYLEMHLNLTISPMDYMGEIKNNPDDYFLVDVRNAPPHLKKEKIQGAVEIPLNEINQQLEKFPKDKQIVVYCWDTWCNMGKKASLSLLKNGYNVKEMTGGIAAWNTLELPVEKL